MFFYIDKGGGGVDDELFPPAVRRHVVQKDNPTSMRDFPRFNFLASMGEDSRISQKMI